MKKSNQLILALLMLSAFAPVSAKKSSCDCEGTGKSYLAIRQHFLTASPEREAGFRNNRTNVLKDGYDGAFQAILFGSRSNDEKALTRYFTPFCKVCLIVDERIGQDVTQDLLAQHFNIFTNNGNFRSRIRFKPRQSVIGLGLHYRQAFKRNEEKGRGFFFSVAAPISRVKNTMELCETIINDGGGANESADENVVANMREAFEQSEWCFGKIDCKSRTKTRLAFLELKVGYEWLQHEPYHFESYFGLILPTGNKSDGVYVFEPISGNGGHFGATFGSAIGFQIWDNDETDRHLRVEYANSTQYLFSKTQKRSFDLMNKPFSRYIEVYNSLNQAQQASTVGGNLGTNLATPGINLFTQDAKVKPGVSHTINTAFVFTSGGFHGEAGYNFYAQSSEYVELDCPFPDGIAIKDDEGDGRTNPIRDMTGNFLKEDAGFAMFDVDDYNFSILTEKDIDLTSGATPCLISHTIFAALGYRWDNRDHPPFIDGGTSYEFSSATKAVMERWTVWLKGGVSF